MAWWLGRACPSCCKHERRPAGAALRLSYEDFHRDSGSSPVCPVLRIHRGSRPACSCPRRGLLRCTHPLSEGALAPRRTPKNSSMCPLMRSPLANCVPEWRAAKPVPDFIPVCETPARPGQLMSPWTQVWPAVLPGHSLPRLSSIETVSFLLHGYSPARSCLSRSGRATLSRSAEDGFPPSPSVAKRKSGENALRPMIGSA